MTTTNTQGAAIARYKIGYYSDDWGIRTSTPSALLDEAGTLVQYADHIAAMQEAEATHLRELAAYRLTVENLEREIAAINARHAGKQDSVDLTIAYLDGFHSGKKAQQPAPSPAPAGWKLVPVEPTEEMLKAADDGDDAYTLRCFGPDVQRVMQGPYDHYCAMLDAAPTAQADTQPAPVEVADAMADSQYLAGVSAGWNAANADNPNEALRKLNESRAGYLKSIRAARAPADSVQEDAARLDWLDQQCEGYGFQDIHEGNRWGISGPYANVRQAIDYERAARKQGEKQ